MLKLKYLLILGVMMALFVAVGNYSAVSALSPPMGTAGNFAVLAGSTATNTGLSVLTGNLGVWPGTAITGFPPGVVNGTTHHGGAVAQQAQSDLTVAYNDLAGRACNVDMSGIDLGGQTLTEGVYCFSDSAALTGQLTLDAQGDSNASFIFQIGSTLTTVADTSVLIINGSKACNVFWQVGSSATLGTGTAFAGNILALTSITVNNNASMFGAALARGGAVTMDTNNISKCFGPTAIAIREFQATSAAGSPFGLAAGAALLLALGLIVIRRRVLATPSAIPSARQRHGE